LLPSSFSILHSFLIIFMSFPIKITE
jgi:hypothetical protein